MSPREVSETNPVELTTTVVQVSTELAVCQSTVRFQDGEYEGFSIGTAPGTEHFH